jgi:hypothetical protein
MLELGKWCLALASSALLVTACGDDGGGNATDSASSSSTTASTSDSSTTDTTSSTSSDSTTEPTTGPTSTTTTTETGTGTTGANACADEIAALAPSVTDDTGGCSVVVRLDYENLDVLGWNAQCGATGGTALDEAGARALTDCCTDTGNRLNPEGDEQFFVFSVDPADEGDVAVVSNHLQALVFEGTMIYDGDGEIGFPSTFEDETALASGCSAVDIPKTITYDVLNGGQPLPKDEVADVLAAIRDTALPGAMNSNGEVMRAIVLHYQPSLPSMPNNDEYVVIVEGGQPS